MHKSSSSSQSIGFDKSTKGDDLPLDSHAPEPERPVSRNAMAKAREKERQRSRTNSTSTYHSEPPPAPFHPSTQTNHYQHPQSMTRERHDSSPATSAPWSMYHQQQSQYEYALQPAVTSEYAPAPSENYSAPRIQQHTQMNGWSQPLVIQPHYGMPSRSPFDAHWTPVVSSPASMASFPVSMNHSHHYPSPVQQMMPSIQQQCGPVSAWVGSQSPIPFPSNMSMPPPPPPGNQPVYPTSNQTGSKPLPSPSRSSSQSSSVGTGSSSPSLRSMSGTVRRSLPQPPGMPLTKLATVDSPSLGRHDSVRMAAEEMMARGPPRRKNKSVGSRFTPSNIVSKSDGSITEASGSTMIQQEQRQPHPTRVVRAESSSCLEKEMREMKLNQERRQSTSTCVEAPHREIIRAASPRPIRAAPDPAPQVAIAAPVEEVIPARPRSRGPKDERERRSLIAHHQAVSNQIPVIFSPPPDTKPAIPIFSFDESPSVKQNGMMPSIVFPQDDLPSINIDNISAIQVNEVHVTCPPPLIQVDAPFIHVSPDTSEDDEEEVEGPKASISISVSSSSVAQRSTTTTTPTTKDACSHHHHHQDHHKHAHDIIARQAAAEPASASSVGSGASCATCQKWIGGRVVHAMNLTFHPDCFVCCHCSEQLEHVAFYEHEGRPYCHFDYHELFSKRCFHCRTPIVDQRYITINDVDLVGGDAEERCYHDLHFFCANCGDPFLDPKVASSAAGSDPMADMIEDEDGKVRFGGREFVVHKGYPYCEKCHVNLHKPRCKGCKKPIIETDFLTALKAKWHLNCFCCQICQNPISSENFFVKNGEAFDEECYKVKLRSEL